MIISNNVDIITSQNPYVFVIESIDTPIEVTPSPSNGKYEYIATVAKFNITNENGREYIREDYLKHLPGLKDRILKKTLMGELDHPQNYDTSLKNVSHLVTDVWYDKSDDTVKIKLELVDTPYGKIAKILIDAGIQLSISSRSAGKVDAQGRVTLFRIFTFDLVAEPGFAQAVLLPSVPQRIQENFTMLNESFNYSENNCVTNKMDFLYESKFYGDNAKIYKVNDDDISSFEKSLNKQQNKNNINEMISRTEFDAYSKIMQKELTALRNLVNGGKINEAAQAQEEDVQAQTQAQDQTQAQEDVQSQSTPIQVQVQTQMQEEPIQVQSQPIQVQAQPVVQPMGSMTPNAQPIGALGIEGIPAVQPVGGQVPGLEMPNGDMPTVGDTMEVVQKLINYINFIAKQLEAVMGHSEIVTEMMNRTINYSETIGQTLNEHINYTNATNKLLNETINYTQELAGVINENGTITEKTINYLNLIGTRLNETIELSNVISDKTQKAIEFSEYNANVFNEHVDFTNLLANEINGTNFTNAKAEGITNRNLQDNVSSISESTNNVLTEVDKVLSKINERSNTSVLESQFPFLKLLTESNKQVFYKLDNDTKVEVVATLKSGVYFNEGDVMSVVNGILENKNKDIPTYVKLMPDKYKQVYESLNENEKGEIHRKATSGFYRLNTPYQVKSFWDSQQLQQRSEMLEESKNQNLNQQSAINENNSQSTEGITRTQFADYNRGYNKEYIQMLTRHAGAH